MLKWMKSPGPPAYSVLLRFLGAGIVVATCISLGAQQRTPTKKKSALPDSSIILPHSQTESAQDQSIDSELRSWQIENLRAQTDYYNRRPSPLERLSPWASGLAAIVAFVTLVVNYRSNVQSQRDTKFYEALKRFGDKDSPSVRVSAALLLTEMAQSRMTFALRKKRSPYLSTVLQQFVAGMMLEENPVALETIQSAFSVINPYNTQLSASLLFNQNRSLATNLVSALAEFLAVKNVAKLSDVPKEAWTFISTETGFSTTAYEGLLQDFNLDDSGKGLLNFDDLLNRAIARFSSTPDDSGTLDRRSLTKLRAAADLMQANIQTCARAWAEIMKPGTSAGNLFLPGCKLLCRTGSGVNLFHLNLQSTHLYGKLAGALISNNDLRGGGLGGNFRRAWMQHTDLRGTEISHADLRETYLYGSLIDANTSVHNTNWWCASFESGKNNVDTKLIIKFFQSWDDKDKIEKGELEGERILAEAHASVKPTLNELLKTYRTANVPRSEP